MREATLDWAGETFRLLPGRAAYWPRRSTLIVADPHFGKSDHFRRSGIPVPRGSTDATLRRLDDALQWTKAARLLILGDLFHSRGGLSDSMLDGLRRWRRRRASLAVALVTGNHDVHAGAPPEELRFESLGEEMRDGGILFRHKPEASDVAPVMAGHLHPAVTFARLRMPCFHFGERVAVLPAFGAFTGMRGVQQAAGDRIFAAGPDAVIEVTRP